MKDKIISELKRETVLLESSESSSEADRHIYAMERLLEVLKSDESSAPSAAAISHDDKMLELMGGKPVKKQAETYQSGAEREKTDDGVGNGESIFDF